MYVCIQKDDPFWEPTDVDVQIGSVHVYLQSLTYMVNWDDVVMMQCLITVFPKSD